MNQPSKPLLIALIAVILVIAGIIMVMPVGNADPVDADLLFCNDSGTPVGSVCISFANETCGAMNADGSLLKRGATLSFDDVEWPVTVTVCGDLQGYETLAQIIVEEAPAEGWLWRITLVDSADGVRLMLQDVPRG